MNKPFRLDEHRRRPQPPLAPPPDRYFDQLPMRVMQRVQAQAPVAAGSQSWLAVLTAPMRTALASAVVLGGFAATFWLSPGTTGQPAGPAQLAQVPREELVQYLMASEQRVTLSDLAELPAAQTVPADSYLHASPDELQDALDGQPSDESYL